ncbi:hypothetical protein A8990_109109 [Paenibacillus taihuensis]|uniref:Uncharacterized protein n=1 Tax=Paenibacillus taihuensis TaxID=1156355 RepID=A0A3D9S5E6_9BACL|nr:hypothetical protein A8990_109109 [Paenibacillus taihuensis]
MKKVILTASIATLMLATGATAFAATNSARSTAPRSVHTGGSGLGLADAGLIYKRDLFPHHL